MCSKKFWLPCFVVFTCFQALVFAQGSTVHTWLLWARGNYLTRAYLSLSWFNPLSELLCILATRFNYLQSKPCPMLWHQLRQVQCKVCIARWNHVKRSLLSSQTCSKIWKLEDSSLISFEENPVHCFDFKKVTVLYSLLGSHERNLPAESLCLKWWKESNTRLLSSHDEKPNCFFFFILFQLSCQIRVVAGLTLHQAWTHLTFIITSLVPNPPHHLDQCHN